jgi:alpha-amylase
MPWGSRDVKPGAGKPRDEELRKLYQKLTSIRRAHVALSRGTHQGLSTEGDVYVYLRHEAGSGDAVMVAINRGQQQAKVSLPWPAAWGGTAAEDLLNGGRLEGPTLELTVEPLGARILGRIQTQQP